LNIKPHDQSDVFDGIRELIRLNLIEKVIPSLAVAVAKDVVIVWEEGFGWADRENRVPANEHTVLPGLHLQIGAHASSKVKEGSFLINFGHIWEW
jgi:hypothetical protein